MDLPKEERGDLLLSSTWEDNWPGTILKWPEIN